MLFFIASISFGQDSSLFNSSWADSLRNHIQDSVRNKKKAVTSTPKPAAANVLNDSAVVKPQQNAVAQQPINDSIQKNIVSDSFHRTIINDSLKQFAVADSIALIQQKRIKDSIAKADAKPTIIIKKPGIPGDERFFTPDLIFYILIFILFFLALIKTSFPKYFNSIFSLSFQATFRQSQTREQMSQNFFPAFMLNVLFILSAGLFITLFAQYNNYTTIPFWQLFIYSTCILAIIYLIKYIVIFFTGWVFNAADAASEYRFIVFLINKLLGILFIPLLFLIAYSNDSTKKIVVTIALCLVGLLIALRYLISVARIRKNLNITAFHFFIYICAAEILPLLVIYKLLFIKTANT